MHVEVDGTVFRIVEFQHVKPGKGGAFVRTKLKRVADGALIDRTFLKLLVLTTARNGRRRSLRHPGSSRSGRDRVVRVLTRSPVRGYCRRSAG